ncbi:MAG: hypothetical protein HFH64_06185 [Lachnospiraceae bacterium]|nr:hypothetical protein [Lachnospiraceae bacterium]
MKKRKMMSAAALMMAGTLTLQSVQWPVFKVFADDAENADGTLAYFVDCGDYDVTTVSEGDSLGIYNSVTEQVYGEDPKTGKTWGIKDTISEPLENGTANNAAIVNAPYTDWTWPFESNTGDGVDKTLSNRYTKNQFEKGVARNLHYAFEVPNGEYTVVLYFSDPWNCSNNPKVAVEGETVIEAAVAGMEETTKVTVSDNELNLDITSDNLCINLAYIKIYAGNKPDSGDKPGTGDNPSDTEYIKNISDYDLWNVAVTDSYLTNAEEKDIKYLLNLDADRLLAGFRETAGLDMKGKTRYGGGWEDALIGGHTMGHYLTAMAQAVAELPDNDTRKAQVEEKLNYIITELEKCQNQTGTGFIFGARILDENNIELQFDNVEKGLADITREAWVPWYTMHKVLAGLIDTYKYTGNETALSVAKKLGDWVYARVLKWDTATQNKVLAIEYGGMNDCLYELYAVTGEDKYAEAAHKFDEESLFKLVASDSPNALNNKHANTTIPKFLGALNRYVTTNGKTVNGETVNAEDYLAYAEKFFDMVVDKHSYITGDNSEWEHFGADYILDAERTNCNCETCNAYNMMKLAKGLYMVTGKAKYLDFYERAFYNTILSSQNPETGMTTYFQPMASGYFKVYGTAEGNFWCCTGSGMENFTKLGNAIYYHTDDMVIVNQYLSSVLTDADKNIKLTQTANIPAENVAEFTINSIDGAANVSSKLALRLPEWLAGNAEITVNNVKVNPAIESGYAILESLKNNDRIAITLPMEIKAYNLPDNEAEYAFKYGPIVLSAKLGTSNMATSTTGVNVTIPSAKLIEDKYITDKSETISVINGTVAEFMANINDNLVKTEGKLEWTLENTDANLTFVPHYSQHTERYGIYFNYVSNTGAINASKYIATKAQDRFNNALLDTVQPGYGQYENDELHDMKNNGSTGVTDDGTYRFAQAGGSFAYTMKAAKGEDNYIQASFRKADNGKSIKISVGGSEVYNTVLNYSGEEDEYTVRIKVPSNVIAAAAYSKTVTDGTYDVVDVKIESADDKDSARVCSYLYITKAYSSDASLSLEASKGIVTKDGNTFTVNVGKDVSETDLTTNLASEYGYIRINGTVVRETVPYTVDLGRNNFVTLNITVFAEDHETSADYMVNIIKETDLADRKDVDKNLAYFVNCGDYDITTLSEGDLFGLYNGVTDQAYGMDPVTGYTWGIVDTVSNPLVNGKVENNAAMTNAVFTDWTWPFETDASVTDTSAKTATNRYTKNQFESGVARNLNYSFGLPNGEYTVELYFTDPWNCSKNPIVSAEGQKLLENVAVNQAVTTKVTVADNILDLNITAPEATLCINLAYIKIYMPEAEVPQEPTTEEPATKEPVTDGQQNPPVQVTTENETTTGEDKTVKNPIKTGDSSKTGTYTILLCLSFAVMAAVIFGKKKREVK